MELIKTDSTFSWVNNTIWSEAVYSPASAADGKRRHKHNQTADVAIFLGCVCISSHRDVARPKRRAIFPLRAAAAAGAPSRLSERTHSLRCHKTCHNFFCLCLFMPTGLRGSSPCRANPKCHTNSATPHDRPFVVALNARWNKIKLLIHDDLKSHARHDSIQEISCNGCTDCEVICVRARLDLRV